MQTVTTFALDIPTFNHNLKSSRTKLVETEKGHWHLVLHWFTREDHIPLRLWHQPNWIWSKYWTKTENEWWSDCLIWIILFQFFSAGCTIKLDSPFKDCMWFEVLSEQSRTEADSIHEINREFLWWDSFAKKIRLVWHLRHKASFQIQIYFTNSIVLFKYKET